MKTTVLICMMLLLAVLSSRVSGFCGDGFCESAAGSETCLNCTADCGACGAPLITSSTLDSKTGSVVTVVFSCVVSHPTEDKLGSCDSLISNAAVASELFLGTHPICRWTSDDTTLIISLGFNAWLAAGRNFSFLPNAVASKATGLAIVTSVEVEQNSLLDDIEVILEATTASRCDPVELHAELSHGAGSHLLQTEWILVHPTDEPVAAAALALYNGKFQAYVIPAVGTNYTIRVKVTDEYGRVATADKLVFRSPDPIPSMIIEGPTTRTITEGEDFVISVYPYEMHCPELYNVTWASIFVKWFMYPELSAEAKSIVQWNAGMLSIPGEYLTAGVYSLLVTSYTWGYRANAQATLVVQPKLLLSIGGDVRLANKNSQLSLVASTTNPTTALFSWSCQDDSGVDVVTPITSVTGWHTFNTTIPTSFTDDHLKCCVKVVDGSIRTRTECVTIKLMSSPTLSVYVVPEDTERLVSRDSKITIFGGLYIASAKATFSWSVTPATFTLNSQTLLSDPIKSANLVIRPGVLDPSKTYRFRLTATSADGTATGYAETVLTTDTEPFGGTMTISPLSGTSLSTIFTLDFEGWKDQSGSVLMYAVSYLSHNLGTLIPIRWYRSKSHLENIRLPMGINGVLTLIGYIRNSCGTVSSYNLTVQVTTITVGDSVPAFAAMTPDYLRCGALNDLDVCTQVCALIGVSMTRESLATMERIWFVLNPASYKWFIDHTLMAVYNITNSDMLVRSVTGLTEAWDAFSLSSVKMKNGLLSYTQGFAKQIVKIGIDKQRSSITNILSVYETLVHMVNSTTGINTTNALAGADELVESILEDLNTHVCGEEGTYDTYTMNITNFRDPADTVMLSGKGVSVEIQQGEPCLSVQWRSYETSPFQVLVVVTQETVPVSVVSTVIAVLVVDSSNSSTTSSAVRTTKVTISFDMPSLRSSSSEWCLWKKTSDDTWSKCGTPTYNYNTNKALCTCPIGGYYILGQYDLETDADAAISLLPSLFVVITLLLALIMP